VTLTIADTRGLRADDGVVSSSGGPRSGQRRRRVFTPEYKLRMVAEYERASAAGERGGLLRREGLYHSHIIEWRKARDAGTLVARAVAEQPDAGHGEQDEQGAPRRRRRDAATAEQAEVERLRRQNEKLTKDLARTQAALDIMGKAHALLELLSESAEPTREPGPSK
jgi:transposase-like protein